MIIPRLTQLSRRDSAGGAKYPIGVADVSLRGLGSPKEGEQKHFLVTLFHIIP